MQINLRPSTEHCGHKPTWSHKIGKNAGNIRGHTEYELGGGGRIRTAEISEWQPCSSTSYQAPAE